MKDIYAHQTQARKNIVLMQAGASFLTALVFLYYAFTVETDHTCYYSESTGLIFGIDPTNRLTDVSKHFNTVIIGFAVAALFDFIMQMLRYTESFKRQQHIIVILSLVNFLVVIGFFIAIHFVRFSEAGRACSAPEDYFQSFALNKRGLLLKAYVIAAWSAFGLLCVGSIIFAVYLKKR